MYPFISSIPSFQLFGIPHLAVLFLTFFIPVSLILYCRQSDSSLSPPRLKTCSILLASILILNKIVVFSYACYFNTVPWELRLPMHLCDWATFIAAAALIWKKQLLFELTYFWGLAGTLQAVITPDLPYGFPHFYFFTFNISHSGIVIAVLFLVFGHQMRPYPRSIITSFLWLQFYLVITAGTNWLFKTNYGYLCDKPQSATLIDHMGEWPYYIVTLEIIAFLFFLFYYLPFYLWDQIKKSDRK